MRIRSGSTRQVIGMPSAAGLLTLLRRGTTITRLNSLDLPQDKTELIYLTLPRVIRIKIKINQLILILMSNVNKEE